MGSTAYALLKTTTTIMAFEFSALEHKDTVTALRGRKGKGAGTRKGPNLNQS